MAISRRLIDSPEKSVLTKSEVCSELRLQSPRQLDGLIRAGYFPRGIQLTAKSACVWKALDVACYLHLRSRGALAGEQDTDEEIEQ